MDAARATRLLHLLHLFALCAFAFQQPLLDILALDTGFLVARGLGSGEIVGLVVLLVSGPPLLLWGAELLASQISRGAERWLHVAWGSGLVALILLPLIKESLPSTVHLLVAAASGVALFGLSVRFEVARSFLSVLGIAPILFAALFFLDNSVATLVFGSVEPSEYSVEIEADTPVVMIVFDELSLISLLDRDGAIDEIRYPAFAKLARESHWLRNASAVDWRTLQVVPAMLSGRYPRLTRRPAVAAEHPNTLFSLLSPYYQMNINETQTQLYAEGGRLRSRASRFGSNLFDFPLLSDLFWIYLHIILPDAYAEELPAVDRTWKDFAPDEAAAVNQATAFDESESPGLRKSSGGEHAVATDRAAEFRHFIASIQPTQSNAKPGFHFMHSVLPHSPWEYMPSGARYRPKEFIGSFFGTWLNEPWWVIQSQQRHLLQLAFVDRLLGELLEHLEETGLYDDSLLVVTADHGVSFWPEGAYRDFALATHPGDILGVPLFIKEPGQSLGSVRRESVQSIDVTPIILDLLGIELLWRVDGCSLFDPACRPSGEKVGFSTVEFRSEENRRLTYPVQIGMELDSLDRQFEIFGDGRRPMGLYRIGPRPELIQTRVRNFEVSEVAVGGVRLSDEMVRGVVPLRVRGTLELTSEAPAQDGDRHVAVVVDGIIWAVVPALTDGKNELREKFGRELKPERYVSALLPESVVADSSGEGLRLYLVAGSGREVKLYPLVTR